MKSGMVALLGSHAGRALALSLAAGFWPGIDLAGAAVPWKPEKAVEIIAVNAPGGGSDRIARMMAKVDRQGSANWAMTRWCRIGAASSAPRR